jgi:SAM-dependent methyltransferase
MVAAAPDFPASGLVLDIGGGGEGIIGRLTGDQVVAIDRVKRELEAAPVGPPKIVMNAGDLRFLDAGFATATAFFSLMFMPPAEHSTVFGEVFRVLAPTGRFLIWDSALPPRQDDPREILFFKLMVSLPGALVDTGYGTFWPAVAQDLAYHARLAVHARRELTHGIGNEPGGACKNADQHQPECPFRFRPCCHSVSSMRTLSASQTT